MLEKGDWVNLACNPRSQSVIADGLNGGGHAEDRVSSGWRSQAHLRHLKKGEELALWFLVLREGAHPTGCKYVLSSWLGSATEKLLPCSVTLPERLSPS